MLKPIQINNPRTGKAHKILPSAMRRCERCERVMWLYKYWWDTEKTVRLTYRCDCQNTTKLKTIASKLNRQGDLQ